jgi:hypothetical protein
MILQGLLEATQPGQAMAQPAIGFSIARVQIDCLPQATEGLFQPTQFLQNSPQVIDSPR